MKKYTKPALAVERFELTQHIASCNAYKINFLGSNCVLNAKNIPDVMLSLAETAHFMSGAPGCIFEATDGEICYNSNVNMAFTS